MLSACTIIFEHILEVKGWVLAVNYHGNDLVTKHSDHQQTLNEVTKL